MLQKLLPDEAIAIETREPAPEVRLFPQEEATLGQAVERRRSEFATSRACAHEALERLGLPAAPVTSGPHGEPRWPAGIVGSITHCEDYCACALAHRREIATIGVDAELHTPLPGGVLAEIMRAEELPWLRELRWAEPDVYWDRVLFSAKESVYKAWYPLAERWLGFEDVSLAIDLPTNTFSARLLIPGPAPADRPDRPLSELSGRWLVREGLVLTAIALADPWDSARLRPTR
jgi:4'-phosphopantetheinyl transferase EntD